jgi:hypothetical protein
MPNTSRKNNVINAIKANNKTLADNIQLEKVTIQKNMQGNSKQPLYKMYGEKNLIHVDT